MQKAFLYIGLGTLSLLLLISLNSNQRRHAAAELALTESAIRTYGTDYASEVFFESGEYAYWVNTNKIVNPDSSYYHPSCIGLKTGHTSTAGYCLLSAFEIDGRTYIVGVFGCPGYDDRFSDTLTLIDHYT